ncbi:hypothetical protein O181_085692 [Austropuccinia psidii MF-1]|uniref:Uncharacterized protein n=1 Tax=Austropuccinia psidii MF-1 TaxID=1389203 RepID=A0A9Q3FWJ8_9BASI|nr:hypothetical protein [Austropuccinia psidii MF-1]
MEKIQPSTTQASAKNSPSSQQQQLQREKAATSPEEGQRQSTIHKTIQPVLQNPKDSVECHGKCILDIQNNDGIAEKRGSLTKISEMISDIVDNIPNLYIAINYMKSHICNKNASICNNHKTKNLSLRQINETLMCFETGLREIKTSNNENSFGNMLNEQSVIIKELTHKHYKFNTDGIIETRIKQTINIIEEDNKKVLDNIRNSFN